MISLLAYISVSAAFAGIVLFVVGLLICAFAKSRVKTLRSNPAEYRALIGSITTAFLGAALLFVFPFYSTSKASGYTESGGIRKYESIETTNTLIEVNGPGVAILFLIPIAFALLPLLFASVRIRPAIQGVCAFLLGGQAAIGMSGYGTFFGPSAVLMVVAGIFALVSKNAT